METRGQAAPSEGGRPAAAQQHDGRGFRAGAHLDSIAGAYHGETGHGVVRRSSHGGEPASGHRARVEDLGRGLNRGAGRGALGLTPRGECQDDEPEQGRARDDGRAGRRQSVCGTARSLSHRGPCRDEAGSEPVLSENLATWRRCPPVTRCLART